MQIKHMTEYIKMLMNKEIPTFIYITENRPTKFCIGQVWITMKYSVKYLIKRMLKNQETSPLKKWKEFSEGRNNSW